MKNIKKLIAIKRRYGALYNKLLVNIPGLQLPAEKPYAKNIYWMYGIVLRNEGLREKLMRHLKKNNIESRAFFIPMHKQPLYKKDKKESYPVSEFLGRNGLYLPSASQLSKKEKDRVIAAIKEFFIKSAD